MTIKKYFQQHFAEFFTAMESSPNRDLVIYRCSHALLIFVAVIFVLAGFPSAVLAAIILSLALTGQDAWQVDLSRRCSLFGLLALAVYVIVLFMALPIAGFVGSFASPSGFFILLALAGSLILWFWAADGFYNAKFRLPPEDAGPW